MIIALDCDGVLRNFTDKLIEVYKEDYPDHDVKPIDRWFFENSFPIGKHIYQYYKDNGARIFPTADAFYGAKEFVAKLKELGHQVIIVTTQPDCQEYYTKSWVKEHIGDVDDIIFAKHKYFIDFDVLLDDAPHNIEECLEHNKIAIFLNQKWNEDSVGIRVNDYDEFIDLITNDEFFGDF